MIPGVISRIIGKGIFGEIAGTISKKNTIRLKHSKNFLEAVKPAFLEKLLG